MNDRMPTTEVAMSDPTSTTDPAMSDPIRVNSSSRTGSRRWTRVGAAVVVATLVAAGCSGDDGSGAADGGFGDPGDCAVVDVAVSSEKIDLMEKLARDFNGSDAAEIDGGCGWVQPFSKASGGAADLLATTWPESGEGNRPVIWSPAASSWGQILNQRLADAGQPSMVTDDPVSFMLTPLVIAMPRPMAEVLGWPDADIGWADIAALATSPDGWGAHGRPEWGQFRLGKTNPNFSTSGLSALISQTYAATGKTRDLSSEDLNAAATEELARQVESSVVHYGDITMTFLNNWYRTDRAGTSMQYVSAVAVEEKSLIDYNLGNPDGVLEPGEVPRAPRIPLVAIYPSEGTLYSDNPLYVLDAPWVSDEQAAAAEAFINFVQLPTNQTQVLEYGFRPGNPDVGLARPITAANGVNPNQPSTLLQTPSPPVMIDLLDKWKQQRKGARVMLVLDVSGSMAEPADTADPNGPTKLDLAKQATIEALSEFNDTDQVGLRVFTTGMGPDGSSGYMDLLEVQPMSTNREALANRIREQVPLNGTPLYEATASAFGYMENTYDPELINAVVLLTDGRNEDGDISDDQRQLQELVTSLQQATQGEVSTPVRIFPIAYGQAADMATLTQIAEASNAAAYDASDPETIVKVFAAVVSNF